MPRSLARCTSRRCAPRFLAHYTSRMRGGVHHPHQPDCFAFACRALEEVVRVDERLRPFTQEQLKNGKNGKNG